MPQDILWLYSPTLEWQSRLQWMHVKTFFPVVAVLFSFLRVGFSLAASLRFFVPRSIPRCKSQPQRQRLLTTYSHLSIFMSITLMSLLQMPLKRRCDRTLGRLLIKKDLQNPPISKLLLPVFLSSRSGDADVLSPGLWEIGDWPCSISTLCIQQYSPRERQKPVQFGTGIFAGDARTKDGLVMDTRFSVQEFFSGFTPEAFPTMGYGSKSADV